MEFARYLAEALPPLMATGAIVLGDRPMDSPRLEVLALPVYQRPDGLAVWPYHLYRVRAA
ncbi:hypothetical protein D3C83_242640 [compost metagenome]